MCIASAMRCRRKHLQQWMRNSCRLTRHAHTATAIAVQACGARAAHSTCGPSLPCLRDMQARSVLYASWQARRHRLARPQLCASAQAQAHAHHLCSCISSRRCRRAAGLLAANGVALYVRKAVAIPPQMRVCGHCCTMRKHKLAATFHALCEPCATLHQHGHTERTTCASAAACDSLSAPVSALSSHGKCASAAQPPQLYTACSSAHIAARPCTTAVSMSPSHQVRRYVAKPVRCLCCYAHNMPAARLRIKPRYAPGCTARARHQLRTQASAARAAAAARRCTADLCRCCLLAHM